MLRAPDQLTGGPEIEGEEMLRTSSMPDNGAPVNTTYSYSRLTSFTGPVSKGCKLAPDGTLEKVQGGQLWHGEYERITCSGPAEFKAQITSLDARQCLAAGVAQYKKCTIRTKASVGDGEIAISKEYFSWPAGPGIWLLDYDAKDESLSREALWAALCEVVPDLRNAPAVLHYSSSSFVGTPWFPGDARGAHCYVFVQDARDIARAGEVLFKRLALAGRVSFSLNAGGAFQARGLVDGLVWQPWRKIFAGPVWFSPEATAQGWEQAKPAPLSLNDGTPPLDTRLVFPDLSTSEEAEHESLIARHRAMLKPVVEQPTTREPRTSRVQPDPTESHPAPGGVFKGPQTSDHDTVSHWLAHEAPAAVEGAGGDATTYNVACILRDHGLLQEDASALLLKHFNPRCLPPWKEADLKKKIDNAYSYASGAAGARQLLIEPFEDDDALNAFALDPTPEAARDPSEGLDPAACRISDFLDSDPPEIDFVTTGVVSIPAPTISILYGGSGVGKSTLADHIGVAVVTGLDVLPGVLSVREPGPVVVWSGEDPRPVIHKRLRALWDDLRTLSGFDEPPPDWSEFEARFRRDFYLVTPQGSEAHLATPSRSGVLEVTDSFRRLRALVEAVRPRLLVVDTRSRCFPGSEDDNSQSAQVIGVLERLARVSGAGVLLIHHTTKSSRSGRGKDEWRHGLDPTAARGGGALIDNCRAAVGCVQVPEAVARSKGHMSGQPLILLRLAKNSYGPGGMERYLRRTPTGRVEPFTPRPVNPDEDAALRAKIVAAVRELRAKSEQRTIPALARELGPVWRREGVPGASASRVRVLLDSLVADGVLKTVSEINSRNRQACSYVALFEDPA